MSLINQINNFYSKRIQCDTRFLSIRKILIALCPYSEIRNNELIEPITFELLRDNPFVLNGRCYHINTIKNICLKGNKKDPFNGDDIPESIVSLFLPTIVKRTVKNFPQSETLRPTTIQNWRNMPLSVDFDGDILSESEISDLRNIEILDLLSLYNDRMLKYYSSTYYMEKCIRQHDQG